MFDVTYGRKLGETVVFVKNESLGVPAAYRRVSPQPRPGARAGLPGCRSEKKPAARAGGAGKIERALLRLQPVDIFDQGKNAGAHEARFIVENIDLRQRQ